jgi:oxygen-dependent protoporphyrinogen oxidase
MTGRTIVVGGGLAGLAAAFRLARAGKDVVLVEASGRAGGVVRTEERKGYLLEAGPNTVRLTAPLQALIEELDLSGEMLLADAGLPRYIDFGGELHALPTSPLSLARTRLLSAAGKLRLLSEPLRRRGPGGEESVRDFAARRLGPEVAGRLVEPFVAGIFAGDAAALSAAAVFPALVDWEREHGSLLAGALAQRRTARKSAPAPRGLLSFRRGLETLPRALARTLGRAFRPGAPVRAVVPEGGRWIIETETERLEAERVILATPAWAAAPHVAPFAPEAAEALESIPHPPLAVLHLSWPAAALRRPLRGFGHLVVPSASRRILGAVWSSSLFPGRAPEGRVLLTVFLGGTRDPAAPELETSELVAIAGRDLFAEGLVRGDPELVLLTRWQRAIPQYTPGHGQRMRVLAETEARWPGLRFAGNFREGVSVGDVVAGATAAAAI